MLDRLLAQANPALLDVVHSPETPYYWSMDQGEWASDLAFASPAKLTDLAPRLFRHAWLNFDSGDMMRFLGHKTPNDGPHGNFQGEVVSLIHKIAKTHRYQLSPHGRDVINALLAARRASTATLAA